MAQFSTAEVAAKFETTPRTLRKFLRADAKAQDAADALPGKGSRYAIEGKQLASLKKRFKAWQVDEAKARAARAEAKVAEVEADAAEVEVIDEGPTDADIEALEAELDA